MRFQSIIFLKPSLSRFVRGIGVAKKLYVPDPEHTGQLGCLEACNHAGIFQQGGANRWVATVQCNFQPNHDGYAIFITHPERSRPNKRLHGKN